MALTQQQLDDIEDAVADVATNPAKITTEAGTVEEHSLPDLIEADKYAGTKRARAASNNPFAGIRISRAGFGGTTGTT